MEDGSRHFGALPQTALWHAIREHVPRLPGAQLTAFVCDWVTEAWIDFAFEGQEFSINDQFGEYWFFVADPACPETVLRTVLDHFAQILR